MGWRSYAAVEGESALSTARSCAPHAVILDGMLLGLDGVQVLRRLHYENPHLPVLMLTARDALEHRIDGLSAGADDYVTKPFSLEEVVLRLRGLLRRAGVEDARELTGRPLWLFNSGLLDPSASEEGAEGFIARKIVSSGQAETSATSIRSRCGPRESAAHPVPRAHGYRPGPSIGMPPPTPLTPLLRERPSPTHPGPGGTVGTCPSSERRRR
ncbi:response regulator [Streptomyces canus]|uniref:response regulator n=1 Tax=Streptomyces canus TaxID=58343 RepID=UPI003F53F2F3